MLQSVEGIPGQPHRWAPEICAWAQGMLVQWRYAQPRYAHLEIKASEQGWRDCSYANAGMPNWHHLDTEFRIAPAVAGRGPSIPSTEDSISSGSTIFTDGTVFWNLAG